MAEQEASQTLETANNEARETIQAAEAKAKAAETQYRELTEKLVELEAQKKSCLLKSRT